MPLYMPPLQLHIHLLKIVFIKFLWHLLDDLMFSVQALGIGQKSKAFFLGFLTTKCFRRFSFLCLIWVLFSC